MPKRGKLTVSYKDRRRDDEFKGVEFRDYNAITLSVSAGLDKIVVDHAGGQTTINNVGRRVHSVTYDGPQ